jgi:hypothetical protein
MRGVKTLYLGTSIHIKYEASDEQKERIGLIIGLEPSVDSKGKMRERIGQPSLTEE